VISSLQPSIAVAVEEALTEGSSAVSSIDLSTGSVTDGVNDGPSEYQFSYKVSDDERQTYISQEESREGDQVTGNYNFVDPTGSLISVTYSAGPEGYTEDREVEQGAVVMRETPGPWTGPMAGVDDVQTTSGITGTIAAKTVQSTSVQSQSDLISQILTAIQPRIDSAVQSAISSVSATSSSSSITGSSTNVMGQEENIITSSGSVSSTESSSVSGSSSSSGVSSSSGSSSSSEQENIVNSVISSLGPSIDSAVTSVLTSFRTGAQPRARISAVVQPRSQVGVSSSLGDVFGEDGTSVRVETPDFNFQF